MLLYNIQAKKSAFVNEIKEWNFNFLYKKCLINKDNYYIKQYVKTGDHNILKKHVLELAKVPGQIWETSRVAFDTTVSFSSVL